MGSSENAFPWGSSRRDRAHDRVACLSRATSPCPSGVALRGGGVEFEVERASVAAGNSSSSSSPGLAPAIAAHVAKVLVTSTVHGRIRGGLEWAHTQPVEVEFALREMRSDYVVVGDVSFGPSHFGKVCWRLTSVNGLPPGQQAIARGDHVVLECPQWATKRLFTQAAQPQFVLPAACSALPSVQPVGGQQSNYSGGAATVWVMQVPGSDCAECIADAAAFDVMSAARRTAAPTVRAPVVPRLELAGLQQRRGPHLGGFLDAVNVGTGHGSTSCGSCLKEGQVMELGLCGDLWRLPA